MIERWESNAIRHIELFQNDCVEWEKYDMHLREMWVDVLVWYYFNMFIRSFSSPKSGVSPWLLLLLYSVNLIL